MSEQQTVVDTKAAAQPAVTDGNAPGDVDPLDKLLAEFDQETKGPNTTVTPPETKPTALPDEVVQKVRVLEQHAMEWAGEKQKKAISDTVTAIRGDVPREVFDDDWVEAWLDVQARQDPRLAQAFSQRAQNPRQWSRVQAELGKKLSKTAGKLPDRAATEDREAVTAAVRGASTKVSAEPAPKLGQMSDAELRKYTRENFGF